MLELKNINKYYNAGTVNEMCLFKDFNLSIADGEFVSVIGSNGSGKTSMLNLICGSIPVDSGTITMGGVDITKMPEYKRQRRIGRVYQHPAMGTCPNMTILENMALADNKGKPFNLLPGTNKSRIDFYRDQLKILGLGLEDKMGVKVGVLSGGQRQAMALLMSTMTPIEFLILDEHTAALDPEDRRHHHGTHRKDRCGETPDNDHGHPQSPLCRRVRRPSPDDAPGTCGHGQKGRGKGEHESR